MEKTNHDITILEAVNQSEMPVGALYLSEQTGIPPANIGRTLLRLEKEGWVEKVNNKGRRITDTGRTHLARIQQQDTRMHAASQLIQEASSANCKKLREIVEVRKLLEGQTAELCAMKITEDGMLQLEELQQDYTYELRHGHSGSEQDLALHLKIAEFSGNETLLQLIRLLLVTHDNYHEFSIAAQKANELYANEHIEILQAIRSRDGSRAREEMLRHLDHVLHNIGE